MNEAETYLVMKIARHKMTREWSHHDCDLRRLVGHAGVLDATMWNTRDHIPKFNHGMVTLSPPLATPTATTLRISWEDVASQRATATASRFKLPVLMKLPSRTRSPPPAPTPCCSDNEDDDDSDDGSGDHASSGDEDTDVDDDDADDSSLLLVRVSSNKPIRLVYEFDATDVDLGTDQDDADLLVLSSPTGSKGVWPMRLAPRASESFSKYAT